jgi:hypothetical protein
MKTLARRIFIALIACICLLSSAKAQTTLSAGDIAFTGYNSDNLFPALDTFSFVILKPTGISSGTVISFTDNGWLSGTSSLGVVEGIITWTSGTALPQGAEIKIGGLTALRNGSTIGTVVNTSNAPSGLNLTTTGDQVLAFQGSSTSPTFIAAIHMNVCTVAGDGADSDASNWDGSLTGSNRSAKPPGLTTGTNAIWFPTEVDNARYNCTLATGTQSAVMAAINTVSNWSTDDFNIFLLGSGCAFFVNPLSATQSQTNVSCNGGSNGSASVTASGGTSPYTYSWSPSGGTGATASGLAAGSYTCTITDAASSQITKSFTITQPSALSSSVISQTNVSCNGGSNGATTITASGGTGSLSYNWTPGNPTGDGTLSISGITAQTWTCTITDANSCTKTQTVTITQPTAIASSVTTNNAACSGIPNGSATIAASGGSSGYTYSWSPSGGTSATATGLSAGSYTVTITDANACIKNQSVTIATNNGTQTGQLAGVAGGGSTTLVQSVSTASGYYTDGSCNRLVRVQATGASPVSGNVTTKVWVESSLPTHQTKPYVARHYEITPATNASTATGTVTLYFLQSEFDAFNAVALTKLPTGSSDASGIANLRIGKYSGTSSNNTGLPSSYSSTTTVIDPTDANIVWNSTDSRWEVTFTVSGFSGFVAQTSLFTLPVTWASFTAEKANGNVSLKWQTSTETNSSHFIVEYSIDGNNYTRLGTRPAAGSSNSLHSYEFIHEQPKGSIAYYRIQQVDKDGHNTYSEVRKVDLGAMSGYFSIITNPVMNGKLHVVFKEATVATIYNTSGRIISRQQIAAGLQNIDVSQLATGIYLLQAGRETKKFTVK